MGYAFGDYELDQENFELRRAGAVIPLQPKVFDLIRYLIEQRGRVVPTSELLEHVWPNEFISRSSMSWSVNQARKALRQHGKAKGPIETIYGRGLRFNAEVRVLPRAAQGQAPARASGPVRSDVALSELFVGREPVLDDLERHFELMLGGRGGLSMLSGETGIGKTRCAEEFLTLVGQRGISVWHGRCLSDGAPVLWPWIEILREAAAEAESDALRAGATELLELLVPRMAAGTDHAIRGNLFWLLDRATRFVRDASELAPRVLFLDDLQWADDASLQLLSLLAGELSHAKLMVVVTLREPPPLDDARARHLARLKRRMQHLPLLGLLVNDVRRYIEAVAPSPFSLELAQRMHARTAGNPLFLQETLRLMLLRGVALDRRNLDSDTIELPVAARAELLRASVATLPDDTREMLEVASVIGPTFELSVLERVSGISGPALLELLDAAGSVVTADPRPVRFRFGHELLREAIYEQVPSARRAGYHLAVARQLEELGLAHTRARDLAYHAYRALPVGPAAFALHHARRAARAATAIGAHADAVHFYQWALDAQQHLPEPELRMRCELLIGLGSALGWAGDVASSRPHLESALNIAREHGYFGLLTLAVRRLRPIHVHALAPDPVVLEAIEATLPMLPGDQREVRVELLSQLACLPPHALCMKSSKALSAEAMELARRIPQPRPLFEALRSRLYALSGPADIAQLLAVTDEMLQRVTEPISVRILTEIYVARFYARLQAGDMTEVDAALHDLGRISPANSVPEWQWHVDRLHAMRALHRGEFETAERAFQELHERAARHRLHFDDHFYVPQREAVLRARGSLRHMQAGEGERAGFTSPLDDAPRAFELLVQGRAEEGRKLLDRLVSGTFTQIPENRSYLWGLCQLAIAAAPARHEAAAGRLYELLTPYSEYNAVGPHGFSMGAVACFLGGLARQLGQPREAQRHFERAVALNDATQQPPQAARARYALSNLLLESGEPRKLKRARELAADAEATAEQLDMQPLLARLRALSRRL